MTQPAVLITGGAGFVGGNLCRYLPARGCAVRSLHTELSFQPRYTGIEALLREYERYSRLRRPASGTDVGRLNCPAPSLAKHLS